MKFVAVIAAVAVGAIAFQSNQMPVHAAQQSANPGFESAQKLGTESKDPGTQSYAQKCAICHGDAREGILPGFPPLLGIKRQMSDDKITELIHKGKGRMPGFPDLQNGESGALLKYLTTSEPSATTASSGAEGGTHLTGLAEAGDELFHQNCAFCHGRDAMGGESGPDLTQSKLVLSDKTGEKIAAIVREGKPDNKNARVQLFEPGVVEPGGLHSRARSRCCIAQRQPSRSGRRRSPNRQC